MKGTAVLTAAVLAAIGIGAGVETATTPSGSARQGGAGPCASAQLAVVQGHFGVAAGSIGGVVEFKNISRAPCILIGFPSLQMIDGHGKRIPTEVRDGAFSTVPSLPKRVVVLAPGSAASFDVGYLDTTGYGSASCPTSAELEITPPGNKQPITVPWRIQPFGSSTVAKLRCGQIVVSPVYPGSNPAR